MDSQHKSNWKCPECLNKQPKMGNIHTPVRSAVVSGENKICTDTSEVSYVTTRKKPSKSPPHITSKCKDNDFDLTESKLRDIIQQELASTIQKLVSSQLNTINNQISGFCESINFINAQYEEMKSKLEEKSNMVDQLRKENDQLKTSIKDFASRLNNVEVHMRESNIEINGIPENRSENLANTVVQLSQIINCPMTTDEILHANRVALTGMRKNHALSLLSYVALGIVMPS
ncbi:unnamed protein product, partial [Brenthis ino]